MTRATDTALALAVAISLYVALLVGVIPYPEPIFSQIIPVVSIYLAI